MNNADVAEKLACANKTQGFATTDSALAGSNYDLREPKRPNLRQRVADIQSRAQREERKGNQAAELGFLLDKNPEVARILDLIEEVGR